MEFVKALIYVSSLIALVNGAHLFLGQRDTDELRIRRDTTAESATGALESKELDNSEIKRILSELNVNQDDKQADNIEGEAEKSLGIITKPFKILSSVFKKEPKDELNNQQALHKPGTSYGNSQNSFPQNPWFSGHDQFVNPPFLVPQDHFNGYDKPFIFHLTDSNNFHNGPRPFPPNKPSFGSSQFVANSAKPNYGLRSMTKKKFLSLFKPVAALAAIFKKPIIIKPVTNEVDVVVSAKPQGSYLGNYRPQQGQKPGNPSKPLPQAQKPYSKPNGNLPIRPVFLKPQQGSWNMPHGGFGMRSGPFGPYRRPHWSYGFHDFPTRYQAKATDDDAEPETAPYYMIDDEDESQRQEYPVLIPAELIDNVSFVGDGGDTESAFSFESRTIAERKSDESGVAPQDIPALTETVETKTQTSTDKKE